MALPNIVPHPTPNPTPTVSPWHALEMSTCAVPALWQRRCGEDFEQFKDALLRPGTKQASSYPCQICGHNMAVSIEAPDNIIALYHACPQNCQGIHLTAEDIDVLELDWQKLMHGLCQAFTFAPKASDTTLHNTYQIGSWSADAVPVFLTIQHERYDFQYVVMSLVALYRCKFILLAPTSAHLGANCQSILASVGAAYFDLETHVIITDEGTLRSRTPPGQLFAQFNPEPDPNEESIARQAFAILSALEGPPDNQQSTLNPSTMQVFRLYCMENLSADEVAKRCHCSKGTVINRLRAIQSRTGIPPDKLRAYSSHFERIEESLSDPRAKHIHRTAAIDEDNKKNHD